MFTCENVKSRLSAYLDGELPDGWRRGLEAHLETCSSCRAEKKLLEALDRGLETLAVPAPPGLADKVLSRLPRPAARWWRSYALAASLVLGLILGSQVTRYLSPPAAPPANSGESVALEEVFNDFPQGSWGTAFVSYQEDEEPANHIRG